MLEEENKYKVSNYLNERLILKKVRKMYKKEGLLNKVKNSLNNISCNVTLEILSEMKAENIVIELIGEVKFLRYYPRSVYRSQQEFEQLISTL